MNAKAFVLSALTLSLTFAEPARPEPGLGIEHQLPLRFEQNRGQVSDEAKFLSRNSSYTLFLTPTEAVVSLANRPASFRMRLVGANPLAHPVGEAPLTAKTNYFVGPSENWRKGISNYSRVRYANVYSGIDLLYYGNPQELEHDFVVAPGADASKISLAFSGATSITLDESGDLVLQVSDEQVRLRRPVAYQETPTGRIPVAAAYVLQDDYRAAFLLGDYDSLRPLIIDPVLSYSTYLGGNAADLGSGIAVGGDGSVYVAGRTGAADFPTQNPFQPDQPDFDVFVSKFNPAGDALIYSTYLGGSGTDQGVDIAIDDAGNAYITGSAGIPDFPTTDGAYQEASGGGPSDVFVAKLSPAGDALVYSTLVGGHRHRDRQRHRR